MSGASRTVEEFRSELVPEKEIEEARRAVEEIETEIVSAGDEGGEDFPRKPPSPARSSATPGIRQDRFPEAFRKPRMLRPQLAFG